MSEPSESDEPTGATPSAATSIGAEQDAATRGVDRLVTFSDAVVAIAITLIVLPLVDSAREVGSFIEFWRDNHAELVAAAVSFAVIGVFQRMHHRLFLRVTHVTSTVMRLNLLWLAAVVTLPIAATLEIIPGDAQRSSIAFYLGTIVVAMTSLRALHVLLARGGALPVGDGGAGTTSARGTAAFWLPVALMVVVLVVAVSFPDIGLWWVLLLYLTGPIERLLHASSMPGR